MDTERERKEEIQEEERQKVEDELKIIISNQMKKIYSVWDGYHLQMDIQTQRARIIWNHIINLLEEVYVEENTFYELYKERIKNYKAKIAQLHKILKRTPPEPVDADSWIAQEEMLSQNLFTLNNEIKEMRLEAYQESKTVELRLCQKQDQRLLSNTEVPSQMYVFELKQKVKIMNEELVQLFDKCYASQQERDKFPYLYSKESSIEVVEALKSEIDKWKKHFSKVEHIVKNIEKRKPLWDSFHILEEAAEEAASDTNRFISSKRNLLSEWKERYSLKKSLLALENEIFKAIERLKSTSGLTFLYNGEDFKAYVEKQRAEITHKKKNKMVEKRNKHPEQLGNEVAFKTPLKRTSSVNFGKTSQHKLLRSKTLYNDDNVKTYVSNLRAKSSNRKVNDSKVHIKNCMKQSKNVNFATPFKRTVKINFSQTAPSKVLNSQKTMSPFNTPTINRSKVLPSTVAGMARKPRPYLLQKK